MSVFGIWYAALGARFLADFVLRFGVQQYVAVEKPVVC